MTRFGNKKTAGFDSKRESRRYQELLLLEKIGEISNLETQVKYELIAKQEGERAVCYFADFRYLESGVVVVEDVKSPVSKTPVYVVKRKLMKLIHNIKIREVM